MRQAISRGAQDCRPRVGLALASLKLGATHFFLLGFECEKADAGGIGCGIRALGNPGAVLFDVKYLLPTTEVDGRL